MRNVGFAYTIIITEGLPARRWLTVVCEFSLPREHILFYYVCVCGRDSSIERFHSKYANESYFPPENGYEINDTRSPTEFPRTEIDVLVRDARFFLVSFFGISRRSAQLFRLIFRFLLKRGMLRSRIRHCRE